MKEAIRQAECAESCSGLTVTDMRHGDPLVCYRGCAHGKALKQRHQKMKVTEIRREILSLIETHPNAR